ncbi:hypothetical protein [Spiroplasma endosymbiont of Thecophora atra]|uniref:hypothetical protein n=1 Tax=Spiroplasma endosymbiont of Thecophora atra TaxID=3066294 RepID=UPI0030D55A99
MQMKNLLRLMGALALTTVATTSVVACGDQTVVNLDTVLKKKELDPISVVDITKPTEKELKEAIKAVPENKNIDLNGITVKVNTPEKEGDPITSAVVTPDGKIYNGDSITITFTLAHKKTDVEVTTDIKAALEKGVDGKSLNDSQKQSDAKDIITAAIKKVTDEDKASEATFTFDKEDTDLTVGDITVNIKVTLGQSKDVAVAVKLTGVTAHKKTDIEVTTDIKAALEKGVDGKSLNDSQKQSDAKDIITAAIKKVTDEDKASEATFTFDKEDTDLTVGDNTVNIKVTLGQSKDVAVAVKLTGVTAHKKTDIEVTTDIKAALEKGVDGKSLNDSQKQSDAKDIITAAIKKVTDEDKASEATFTFDKEDTDLTVGDNTVNIKVTLGQSKDVAVAVKLTGVTAHE